MSVNQLFLFLSSALLKLGLKALTIINALPFLVIPSYGVIAHKKFGVVFVAGYVTH